MLVTMLLFVVDFLPAKLGPPTHVIACVIASWKLDGFTYLTGHE
jgi:hypothetical protein